MEVGTAIFLGAVFIGLTILYANTRDRWNWRRMGRRLGFVFIGIVVVAVGFGVYSEVEGKRPKRETGLWDIQLGASQDDVRFLKGAPAKEDAVSDRPRWTYFDDSTMYAVDFEDRKVSRVIAYGHGQFPRVPEVAKVSHWTSVEELLKRLGEPGHVSTSADGLRRAYSFPKYNAGFVLRQGKIVASIVGVSHDYTVEFTDAK